MMINRRLFLAGTASTAMLAALAACSGKSGDGSTKSDGSVSKLAASDINEMARDKVADGGKLVLPLDAMIPQYNPLHIDGQIADNGNVLQMFIGCSNWLYKPDGTFEVRKDFCESYTVDEKDGKTVATLKLNPKAKWNNGDSITWEDYESCWKACNGADKQYLDVVATTDGWDHIESITAGGDEFEVVVKFTSIFPDWSSVLSLVIPRSLTATPEAFSSWTDPMMTEFSTGPFVITNHDPSSGSITLGRNDQWWGEPGKLETIVMRVIDADQLSAAFANGEVDVVHNIIDAASYQQCEQRTDGEIREASGLQWRHFTINGSTGVLADEKLRQALVKGVDCLTIAQADLQGLPVPAEDLMLGNHLFMVQSHGYEDNRGEFAFDKDAAIKDLEDLGWVLPEGGSVREKDGQKLSIKYLRLPNVSTSATEGKVFQSCMEAIGCEVVMDDTNPSDFFTRIRQGQYEVVTFTWVGTQYPMANIQQVYGKGSASNYTGVWSEKLQDLIKQVAEEPDEEKRIKLANEADREIWREAIVLPIYSRADYTAVPKSLANYGSFGMSTVLPENIGYAK
ncbi:ABC transporter family substrate-binding protein [Actinomyces vulturis]|uniref:ABC transporter family substrate-binding protein n=1 Tax=Actinomyces vulturis TaxID=1857645 RepID=UPI00082FD135|nr:ABC transporter family substrate-binding protein [Actinomyces vulturis]